MSLRRIQGWLIAALMAGIFLPVLGWADVSEEERAKAPRVSVQYAHDEVTSGRALLVCAYPDQEVCDKVMLKGAISLKDLEARLPDLKKDQEIIFYCA